jgi:hypothetical protein
VLKAIFSFALAAAQAAPTAGVPDGRPPVPYAPGPALPAAEARIKGVIVAKGTREALGGASIAVDATAATEADGDGRFEISVKPGRRRLQVQHPGFDPLDVTVDADEGTMQELTIRLMPRLTGERYETVVEPTEESVTKLRQEELTKTPGSLGDPFRVIESLPGVSQAVWPLAIYAVRGANPGNTGFFLDGIRMPTLFHFALGPSVIHPFFLEQIDFYPGGYPVRFGRYVSGIVSATTATPQTDRVHTSLDVRLFDAGGIVAAPWNGGKGSVAVAGRYSYTGFLLSKFSPDYTLSYWDYQIRADHPLGQGRVTAFVFGSGDVLGRKASNDGDADVGFHRLTLKWSGMGLGGRLEVSGLVGRDASATSIKAITALPISVTALTTGGRLAFSKELASWAEASRVELEVGGDGELQRFDPRSQKLVEESRKDLFLERDTISAGAYVGVTLRAKTRLAVSPGFRYDVFREGGTTKPEPGPRLLVRVRPGGDVWLKGSVGRFAQMASLPVAVPGFDGFGLNTYGTQTSIQGSVGVEAKLGEYLSLDANSFYQRLRLTDLASMFNLDPQGPILELRDGRSYGAEVLLRRPSHHRFYGWLAYTLSWSERLIGHYRARSPSDWDQRHILNLVLGHRFRGGYSTGVRFHYNTGRPYPVYDDRYPPEYQRLPAFYQVDLRGDRRFVFDRYVFDVYVELINSTLTREVFDLRRAFDGSVVEKGYRIVLPSIGIHAEW